MNPIQVAIAGAGYSTRVFHLPFLLNDSKFSVKKIYERSSNNAQSWAPNAQIVRSFDELLTDEIDLVIITTPNQTHYDMAKATILAGKHVLVEKPLVPTAAQALELDTLAKQQNVVLSVYQNRRWDAAAATARTVLEQGLIGKPVDCEIRIERYAKGKNVKAWKETGEKGTGLVYDLGVHLIDQAVHLFGKPNAIFADIRYQHEDALSDDNFCIHLYYEDGLKVALHATKYARETGKHFVLHGTLGSYVKQNVDVQEGLLTQGVQPIGDWNALPEDQWGILHTEIDDEIVRRPFANTQTSYQALYDNLAAAIQQKQPLAVTAEQAAYVLSLIEKAFDSAELGKKLSLAHKCG